MDAPDRWERYERYPYLLAKYGGAALIVAAVAVLLVRLRVVMIPILFSGIFAYLLAPAVDFLHRRRVPRTVAAGIAVFFAILLCAALVTLVLPTLYAQLREFIERIPLMLDVLDQTVSPILAERFGISLHFDRVAITNAVRENIEGLAAPTGWVIGQVFRSLVNLGLAVFYVVVVVVFTFYLLRSYHAIVDGAVNLLPIRWRSDAVSAGRAVDDALSAFIRGQVIVCITMAALYSIALSLIGVQGGVVIGILAGLLNFVPYLGILTGLTLSLLSAALDYSGPGPLIAILAVFAGGPLLDATLITPNVVGQRVGLNPFVVIVALLAGAELMGFLGLLLAVPTAAVLRALLRLWMDSYRRSRFYLGDTAAAPPANPVSNDHPPGGS